MLEGFNAGVGRAGGNNKLSESAMTVCQIHHGVWLEASCMGQERHSVVSKLTSLEGHCVMSV